MEFLQILQDPQAVHAMILRGEIKLTKDQALHIAGVGADLERIRQLAIELSNRADELARFCEAAQRAKPLPTLDQLEGIFNKDEDGHGFL